jgi:hypothetical protein
LDCGAQPSDDQTLGDGMLVSPEEGHELTCRHEAGHAVAAFGVGATISHAVVPPVYPRRSHGALVRAETSGFQNEVTILVAGELATDPTIPLAMLIRIGADMVKVRELAAAHFSWPADVREGPHIRYLKRTSARVRRWFALPEQQRAIAAIALALDQASKLNLRVEGDEICRICEECGVERRPAFLQLDARTDRRVASPAG